MDLFCFCFSFDLTIQRFFNDIFFIIIISSTMRVRVQKRSDNRNEIVTKQELLRQRSLFQRFRLKMPHLKGQLPLVILLDASDRKANHRHIAFQRVCFQVAFCLVDGDSGALDLPDGGYHRLVRSHDMRTSRISQATHCLTLLSRESTAGN